MLNKDIFLLEDAICNPLKYFNRPEDVVADSELSKSEKLKILESWKDICQKIEIADSEGMRQGTEDLFCTLITRQGIIDLIGKISH